MSEPVGTPRAPASHDRADPPPFDPDPELIDHLEGNAWSLRGYRREAEKLRTEAGRESA